MRSFKTEAFAHSIIEAAEPILRMTTTGLRVMEFALKIGYVSPQTGPLAPIGEADKWVIEQMKAAFKDGIEGYLELLGGIVPASSGEERRSKSIAALSTMVGALVLSRAVGDVALSQKILSAAADEIAAQSE